MEEYKSMYDQSINEPDVFWGQKAKELLSWYRPFQTVMSGSLDNGDIAWFNEGTLNASYNCIDRHAFADPDKVAIIYEANEEADEPQNLRTVSCCARSARSPRPCSRSVSRRATR